jgi:L-alanine-DL-glutamate epimerase-like enolase superfamily enzyme
VFQVDLPIEGGHRISGGRRYSTLDDTVIVIETDEGISGIGECCPLGNTYLPAFPEGTRAGLSVIAPALIGKDPVALSDIAGTMDRTLMGHPYVKSPIDMACWDIAGQVAQRPLYDLLGGRLTDRLTFRVPIAVDDAAERVLDTLAQRRQQGFHCFNIKVGNAAKIDIERIVLLASQLKSSEKLFADANGGWTLTDALTVLRTVPLEYQVHFEQPCATFEECAALRRLTQHIITLDELIDTPEALMRAWKAGLCESVNLKVSRVGGITKMRLMRDICIELGIGILVQDNWASGIASAAVAHLAHSSPQKLLLGVWGAGYNVTLETAFGAPALTEGCLMASDRSGLGLTANFKVLGEPVAVYV